MTTAPLARLGSARRYLSFADNPARWTTAKGRCPHCGPTVFVVLRRDAFMTRCLRCRANTVTLAPIPVIRRHFGDRFEGRAYELSTFGVLLKWLRRSFAEVVTSEFFPGRPLGAPVGGVLNQDVERLTFPAESFDLVTSNGVFEHVNDDERGFAEVRRVLKPGGAMAMTVPLYDTPCTRRISRYEPDGSLHWLDIPEYHDSRFGGPMSAPVVWLHSRRDIVERVRAAGFSSVKLIDVMLTPEQRSPQGVIYGVR